MSRNDNILNTGMSSPARRKVIAEKEQEPKKPDPKAEQVLEEIAVMKARIGSVTSFISDTGLMSESRLRKIDRAADQYQILHELETRMKRILGIK